MARFGFRTWFNRHRSAARTAVVVAVHARRIDGVGPNVMALAAFPITGRRHYCRQEGHLMLFGGPRLRMIDSSLIQDLVHVRREKLLQMRTNRTSQGIYDFMNNERAVNPLSQIAVGYTRTCNRRPGFERKKLDWNLSTSNTVTVADDRTLAQ